MIDERWDDSQTTRPPSPVPLKSDKIKGHTPIVSREHITHVLSNVYTAMPGIFFPMAPKFFADDANLESYSAQPN